MILKIRFFRVLLKSYRFISTCADKMDKVAKGAVKGAGKMARVNWRKWSRIAVKICAIGTTVTGAVTAVSSSSSATGIAMGAAGATGGIVAFQGIPVKGYERIKHVPPTQNNRMAAAAMLNKGAIGSNKRTVAHKMMPSAGRRS